MPNHREISFHHPLCRVSLVVSLSYHRELFMSSRNNEWPMPERVETAASYREDRRAIHPQLAQMILEENPRGKVVLDVGTGEGKVAFFLAPVARKVVGVDRDENAIAHARGYAAIKRITNVDFILGDVEREYYWRFVPEGPDIITSSFCMSRLVVWRSGEVLRRGSPFIFICHHTDHWKETEMGSGFAVGVEEVKSWLAEGGYQPEHLSVDRTTVLFSSPDEVELFVGLRTFRRWQSDGRWQRLLRSFKAGNRRLTLSLLLGKARKV